MVKTNIDSKLEETCKHSGERYIETLTDHCEWDSEYTSTINVEKCGDCGATLQWRLHN